MEAFVKTARQESKEKKNKWVAKVERRKEKKEIRNWNREDVMCGDGGKDGERRRKKKKEKHCSQTATNLFRQKERKKKKDSKKKSDAHGIIESDGMNQSDVLGEIKYVR